MAESLLSGMKQRAKIGETYGNTTYKDLTAMHSDKMGEGHSKTSIEKDQRPPEMHEGPANAKKNRYFGNVKA